MNKFKLGDVVKWTPDNFNPNFWNNLSETDRQKYYGVLGYGHKKTKMFVFICEIAQTPGHCVLISMDDQTVETMRHTSEFVLVDEDEL